MFWPGIQAAKFVNTISIAAVADQWRTGLIQFLITQSLSHWYVKLCLSLLLKENCVFAKSQVLSVTCTECSKTIHCLNTLKQPVTKALSYAYLRQGNVVPYSLINTPGVLFYAYNPNVVYLSNSVVLIEGALLFLCIQAIICN